MQIGRRRIAARGMLDRGLHDVGERHGAEPLQRLAPGFQRARHGDGFRAVEVFVADGIEHVMRRAGFRRVGIGPDRQRHGALAVDEAMAAVGSADMGHAAADDADHHRLDHRQRKQRRDRRIDGVAAGRQHFRARARCQRMIADHHAAAPGRRLLLALENRWLHDPANCPSCCFPVSCCRFQASAGEIRARPCSPGIARIPQSCIIAR